MSQSERNKKASEVILMNTTKALNQTTHKGFYGSVVIRFAVKDGVICRDGHHITVQEDCKVEG